MTKLDRQQMQGNDVMCLVRRWYRFISKYYKHITSFPCICCLSSLVTMQLLGIAFILYLLKILIALRRLESICKQVDFPPPQAKEQEHFGLISNWLKKKDLHWFCYGNCFLTGLFFQFWYIFLKNERSHRWLLDLVNLHVYV